MHLSSAHHRAIDPIAGRLEDQVGRAMVRLVEQAQVSPATATLLTQVQPPSYRIQKAHDVGEAAEATHRMISSPYRAWTPSFLVVGKESGAGLAYFRYRKWASETGATLVAPCVSLLTCPGRVRSELLTLVATRRTLLLYAGSE